jgi:hypothetical protein
MQKIALTVLAVIPMFSLGTAGTEAAIKRPGIKPFAQGHCPADYPIKGNFTTYSGERCIYHVPGQRFYNKTKAERCYASETEAVEDGCRKSRV